nr:hypothetical protein [Tanacetum cinerariifolium]
MSTSSLQAEKTVYMSLTLFSDTKETKSEPIIWDIGGEEEDYPFVNKYPSFQEEPIVLVEEKSCHVYDTDNEEEELMPVYDTDIEDVIEEEEVYVRRGKFGEEEDNIEDIVVVANDLCSSMIQTILSVDFEEDINTKSHELICDSLGDLCLVTSPSLTPHALLSSSSVALSYPNWRDAMYNEYNTLIKNSTWILVLKPPNVNVVRSMWLFRNKYHVDGTLSTNKACLVSNGHSQQFGVDCDDTFNPVVKPATIRYANKRIIYSLHKEFDMTDLGTLNYFLEIFVTRNSIGMFLSQNKYDMKLLKRDHMANCNQTRTPVDTKSKLGSDGDPISDPTLYRSLAGSLVTYTDVDWVGCPTTRWSTSSYCVFLGDNLLSWLAKRQHTLSRSSVEAEYRGVANVVAETTWLRKLLRELHILLLSATFVYYDNDTIKPSGGIMCQGMRKEIQTKGVIDHEIRKNSRLVESCHSSVQRTGRSPFPSAAISELFKRVGSERDLLRIVSSGLSRGGKRFLADERVLMHQK